MHVSQNNASAPPGVPRKMSRNLNAPERLLFLAESDFAQALAQVLAGRRRRIFGGAAFGHALSSARRLGTGGRRRVLKVAVPTPWVVDHAVVVDFNSWLVNRWSMSPTLTRCPQGRPQSKHSLSITSNPSADAPTSSVTSYVRAAGANA